MRQNKKKASRIAEISNAQLASRTPESFVSIIDKMKFNFYFFDKSQFSKTKYEDLSKKAILKIGEIIVSLCEKSLKDWEKDRRMTRNSSRYEIYGDFPSNSDFTYPKNIPDHVVWARFRLGSKVRLCGFVIPEEFKGQTIKGCNEKLCTNIFYVVFYDHDHKFFKT